MSLASLRLAPGEEDPEHRPPLISLVVAFLPMLPLLAGAALAWVDDRDSALGIRLCAVWAGALICFLAGVRRGLRFRQDGGPTLAQLATTLWLFVLGVASLLSPSVTPALLLQLLAFLSLAVLDPIAAKRGEAPRYFARLRPAQTLLPVGSLLLLLLKVVA